jgi:hypothetical protein
MSPDHGTEKTPHLCLFRAMRHKRTALLISQCHTGFHDQGMGNRK